MVDGGKGQVSSAKDVLDELNLPIPLVGLAKRNEELFLPGQTDPVRIPKDSGALFLVMRLRDEAHRFAISYHRAIRGKKAVRSELLDIPGVGPAKAAGLIKAFGDVDSIRNASVDELTKVPGIGMRLASADRGKPQEYRWHQTTWREHPLALQGSGSTSEQIAAC